VVPLCGIVARRFFLRCAGIDAALRRPRIFSFATLAAAVISVVLPMNSLQKRRLSILCEERSSRALALPSLVHPAFHRNHAPFVPAARIPRIISLIRSG
jgi:hypothetical protein